MRKIIFFLMIGLMGCQYENPEPKADTHFTSVNGSYSKIDQFSVKYNVSNDQVFNNNTSNVIEFKDTTNGDAFDLTDSIFLGSTYRATSTVRVHVRLRVFVKTDSRGLEVYIGKNGNDYGANSSSVAWYKTVNESADGFTREIDISADNIVLNAGEFLTAYINSSNGSQTVYASGSILGQANQYSYFLIEAY